MRTFVPIPKYVPRLFAPVDIATGCGSNRHAYPKPQQLRHPILAGRPREGQGGRAAANFATLKCGIIRHREKKPGRADGEESASKAAPRWRRVRSCAPLQPQNGRLGAEWAVKAEKRPRVTCRHFQGLHESAPRKDCQMAGREIAGAAGGHCSPRHCRKPSEPRLRHAGRGSENLAIGCEIEGPSAGSPPLFFEGSTLAGHAPCLPGGPATVSWRQRGRARTPPMTRYTARPAARPAEAAGPAVGTSSMIIRGIAASPCSAALRRPQYTHLR